MRKRDEPSHTESVLNSPCRRGTMYSLTVSQQTIVTRGKPAWGHSNHFTTFSAALSYEIPRDIVKSPKSKIYENNHVRGYAHHLFSVQSRHSRVLKPCSYSWYSACRPRLELLTIIYETANADFELRPPPRQDTTVRRPTLRPRS